MGVPHINYVRDLLGCRLLEGLSLKICNYEIMKITKVVNLIFSYSRIFIAMIG